MKQAYAIAQDIRNRYIAYLLDSHDIASTILCGKLYALDTWQYRDDTNTLQTAHEWLPINNVPEAKEFLAL